MHIPQGNPDLLAFILNEIRTHGSMPFARFMGLALYHPEHGYYNARSQVFGRGGDYYTSADLHPAFGALVARQCQDMWQAMGRPAQFTIVEMGAGRGFLCRDLLAHLREYCADCFSAAYYIIDERSAARRAEQHDLLQGDALAERVAWQPLHGIPQNSVSGVFLSNELVDAFPVHRVRMAGHGLQEQFVAERDAQLHLTWDAPSTDELIQYLNSMNIALQPGQTAEINLAARQWMQDVAVRLERGFVLTLDYGHPAAKLYSPARPAGTLMCYHKHETAHDPLARIGEQDMTAHVNFTDLIRTGEQHGLRNAGFTRQMFFLGSLGLGEFAAKAAQTRDPGALLKNNLAFKNLIDPAGLGGFGVLLQCKGFDDTPTLRGLRFNPQLRSY